MSKIIVGVDESPGSADAIALASSLAGMTGATLMLVNVFPYDPHPSRAVNADFENFLREDSEALLERLRSAHGDDTAQVKAIAETSPPRALHELAEREDAGLIVVGSTHTGRAGRVMPGSTAERLLHGSPCPVAVAPKDYAHRTLGDARDHRLRLRRNPGRRRRARRRPPARRRHRRAAARDPCVPPGRHGAAARRRDGPCRVQRHAEGPGRE